ncbi:ribosomal protein S1 [Facklamia languida CCUG 37842]|uniref:Ribosomal protein S1 n=2 Tax=Facklamia TaxID=66831 RepID=H3NGL4_9LACT|nr:ribosomal protein S1 [Facklamia languida CCUG 37842]
MSEFVENNEVKEEEVKEEIENQEEQVVSEEVEAPAEETKAVEEATEAPAEEEPAEEVEEPAEEAEEAEEADHSESMTSMADALDSVLDIKVGDLVTGDVLAFDENNQVRVAIKNSGGLEGVIPRNELAATRVEDPSEVVSIGDEIELVVVKPIQDKENGNYLLSKKRVDARKVWEELAEKVEAGETIEAPVKEVVKGGLVVDAGVRGFVPASMVEDYFVDDFTPYKGQTLEFKIVELDPNDNRLILSHKEIARAKREAERQQRLDELEEDSIVEGTVARLTNFGAFIDLGGVDGLVHISRIAHDHVKHPSDRLTVGETIKVKILSVDKEEGRISLSIKDTLPGPWDDIEEKAPEGSVHKGTVKRLTNFGAFVEVFPGVEGLVHISQISHEHIETPQDRLTEGQEVDVKVLSADPEAQRLSLSIKALLDKPEGFVEREEEGNERPQRARKPRPSRRQERPQANKGQAPAGSSTSLNDSATEGSFTLGDMLGDSLKALQDDAE